MELINTLAEQITEENNDADKYIRCALEHKDDMPNLAQTYYTLAGQELNHANMLHDQVVRAISEYKAKRGEPPEGMLALYNYLHGKQIEDTAEVKRLMEMCKV